MDKLWEQIEDQTDRDMSELIGILKNQGMDLLTINNLIKQELKNDTLENILSKYQQEVNNSDHRWGSTFIHFFKNIDTREYIQLMEVK